MYGRTKIHKNDREIHLMTLCIHQNHSMYGRADRVSTAYHSIIPYYTLCKANLISLAVQSMNSAACHRSLSMCMNG